MKIANLKLVIILTGLLLFWGKFSLAAVFGEDNRNYLQPNSAKGALGRATAIAVLTGNESWEKNGNLNLDVEPLSSYLCKDERFSSDPSLSYSCTGFLVGPDLIATAGHCMVNHGETKNETEMYCQAFDWLFDYQLDQNGKVETKNISADQVYHCRQIIYAVNDEVAPFLDFALVQLDRPVLDRKPLTLSSSEAGVGSSVFMIGYPLGTPMKITDGAHVLEDNPLSPALLTNLDAFDGNSGSPVFNKKNEAIGILVSGRPSELFYFDSKNQCSRLNVCDEDGSHCRTPQAFPDKNPLFQKMGADVQRIAPLIEQIEAFHKFNPIPKAIAKPE